MVSLEMGEHITAISKPGHKLLGQNWNSNIKISELLDYSAPTITYRLRNTSGKPYFAGGSAKSERSSNFLHRASPVDTPWSQTYKGIHSAKTVRLAKPITCNLADVERKLSSLTLDHTEDEIYQRHFLDTDDSGDSPDKARIVRGFSSIDPAAFDKQCSPSQNEQSSKTKAFSHKPPRQLNIPSKSSKRHRFCLSKYPHSRKNKKIYFVKAADEIQHEVTVDQKGLKDAWEFYVLGKLSNETQCFINHRFDGKEKPKERLIDFLDSSYREKDRLDYMNKRKRRLFDMPYKHEDFPGASTHL